MPFEQFAFAVTGNKQKPTRDCRALALFHYIPLADMQQKPAASGCGKWQGPVENCVGGV
jgi:hypothetical protein